MRKKKAGRPALPQIQRRKHAVRCMFTDPEIAKIHAMRGGVPIATFVRLRALGGGT